MRLILAALCLAVTTGCCGPTSEPVLELKSPLWLRTQPVLQPQGYAIATPAPAVYAPVQSYQYAPVAQPRAVGPCGDGGTTYSPPPVPGDVPESIPAVRR